MDILAVEVAEGADAVDARVPRVTVDIPAQLKDDKFHGNDCKTKPLAKSKGSAKPMASTRKIDAKQAVVSAVDYFQDFFPRHAKSNMLLEELEESSDGKRWLVTLGYDTGHMVIRTVFAGGGSSERAYKLFSVDSATGKVVSVKIRKV